MSIQPLSINRIGDELSYGGGLVRVFKSAAASPPPVADYFIVPLFPILVPPARFVPAGSDDGSGLRMFFPLSAVYAAFTCPLPPCIIPPHVAVAPAVPIAWSMALSRQLTFGTVISAPGNPPHGPMLPMPATINPPDIPPLVDLWRAGQGLRVHAFRLDLAHATSPPPTLGGYLAIPVVDVTDPVLAQAIVDLFT